MQRRTTSLIALAAVAAIAVVSGYAVSKRSEPVAPAAVPGPATPAAPPATAPLADAAPATPAVTQESVASWIADANGGDAAKRATAIAALAGAPRAEAVPVLRRILINGEPLIDRPLALGSLRDLALDQGDADGAIRDAVRDAIYHGDDQTRGEDVQEVLDIIEESELK